VDLVTLLDSTDGSLMAEHGRWYIAGRQPRYLRRKRPGGPGNVGDGRDPATVSALRRWMADSDRCWPSTPAGPPAAWAGTTWCRPRPPRGRPGPDVTHLLVTNDFPPKVGGIQAYLWELWRRMDPDSFAVLTASSIRCGPLRPRAGRTRIPDRAGPEPGAGTHPPRGPEHPRGRRPGRRGLVVLDPAFPLGLSAPSRPPRRPAHGAEVAIRRLPGTGACWRRSSATANWSSRPVDLPAAVRPWAVRPRPAASSVEIPPGVDLDRFRPQDPRNGDGPAGVGTAEDGPLVVSVSRLVPRKGMDVLIDAGLRLRSEYPDLTVAIAGPDGMADRLAGRIAEHGSPVRLLAGWTMPIWPGWWARPILRHAVPQSVARTRAEGFGIVFLEAAAAGVPQVAGASGGAGEAVQDGETGFVVRRPSDVSACAGPSAAAGRSDLAPTMGAASRVGPRHPRL